MITIVAVYGMILLCLDHYFTEVGKVQDMERWGH